MRTTATFTGHTAAIYTLAQAERPGRFLSAGGDGRVVEWHLARPDAGDVRTTVPKPVFALQLLPERDLLLIGNDVGGLHVIDVAARTERHLFEVHTKGIFRIVPLAGERVACAGGDGSLSIWSTASAEGGAITFLRQIPFGEGKLRDLALSSTGEHLAIAGSDGPIRIVDTRLFNEVHTLEGHPEGSSALAFHPNKPVLLSGGKDGHLRSWRTDQGYRALNAVPAHSGAIYAIAFDPGGRRFATAGRDKMAKLWDAATLDPLDRLDRAAGGHAHSVNALLWTAEGLLTASDDRTIRLWEP